MKIINNGTAIVIILAAVGIVTAADLLLHHDSPQPSYAAETRIITDMKGNPVEVSIPLKRVALFGGPSGQIAYILGAQDMLCAVTRSLKTSTLIKLMDPRISTLPAPRTTSGQINIESLLESEAQLVVAGNLDGDIVKRKTHIPVAFFNDTTEGGFEDVKEEIRFYASVFQKEERAEAYIRYLDNIIRLIRLRTSDIPENMRKKVFNGYAAKHLVTIGGDTFMQERIETAGCINTAQAVSTSGKKIGLHSGLGEVSMEQVLAWNPDIIVIDNGTPEELAADPRWQPITAVKNHKIYIQPSGVFICSRPSAEASVLYTLWLACTAYPDRFSDISLPDEIKNFYKDIFNFDLTDSQVKKIISGEFKSIFSGGSNFL